MLEKVPRKITKLLHAINTVATNKTVKHAIDSMKLKDSFTKNDCRSQTWKQDLLKKKSSTLSKVEGKDLWISKKGLKCAGGQLENVSRKLPVKKRQGKANQID